MSNSWAIFGANVVPVQLAPVATVAALSTVADTGIPDYARATVLASLWHAPWRLDKTSTITPDGVTCQATQSGTGRWVLESRYSGTIPASEVGIDTTGATDAASATTAAASAVVAAGCTLLFPAGTYLYGTSPTIPASAPPFSVSGSASFTGAAGAATRRLILGCPYAQSAPLAAGQSYAMKTSDSVVLVQAGVTVTLPAAPALNREYLVRIVAGIAETSPVEVLAGASYGVEDPGAGSPYTLRTGTTPATMKTSGACNGWTFDGANMVLSR